MNWIKPFIRSTGAILLGAAVTRFLIAASNAQVLTLPEPMLGIPLRYAVLAIGGLEMTVAMICLFGKRPDLQLAWLAWLAADYAVYWIGLFATNCRPQASCIGTLTDPLLLSRGAPGLVTPFLSAYLLLGSYAAVVWRWLEGRRAKATRFLKMSCPDCGVHIRFDDKNLGRKIPCPHCQAEITLIKLEHLITSCFFCKEHIEFPAHALGEKITCPHCNMGITLKKPV